MSGQEQCAGTTKAGKPCRSFALPGSDYCRLHGMSAEERRANAQHAQRRKTLLERREAEPLFDHKLIVEEKALPMLYALLRAEIDEPGFRGPDLVAQGIGMLLLAFLTNASLDPDAVYTGLLAQIPEKVKPMQQSEDEWAHGLRRAWDEAKVKWSEINGLAPAEPYPSFMLGSLTPQQAAEEGKVYLAQTFRDVQDAPGTLADTHISAERQGERVFIPRLSGSEFMQHVGQPA